MRQRDRFREWPQKAQKHKKSRTMRNDQGMQALCDQIRQTAFDLLCVHSVNATPC